MWEVIGKSGRRVKHGYTEMRRQPPEYHAWMDMKQRCYNKHHPRYGTYGARGIKVCAEWLHSFEAFIACLGSRPSNGYSLDRIDNDRGYEPGNCRWATSREQSRNRTSNVLIEIDGVKRPAVDWAEHFGVPKQLAWQRINTGMDPIRAVSMVVKPRQMDYRYKPGDKIGSWTVLERASHPRGTKLRMQRCRCECGTESVLSECRLNSGSARRCYQCSVRERCNKLRGG